MLPVCILIINCDSRAVEKRSQLLVCWFPLCLILMFTNRISRVRHQGSRRLTILAGDFLTFGVFINASLSFYYKDSSAPRMFSLLIVISIIGSANAVDCSTADGSDTCAAAGNMRVSNALRSTIFGSHPLRPLSPHNIPIINALSSDYCCCMRSYSNTPLPIF